MSEGERGISKKHLRRNATGARKRRGNLDGRQWLKADYGRCGECVQIVCRELLVSIRSIRQHLVQPIRSRCGREKFGEGRPNTQQFRRCMRDQSPVQSQLPTAWGRGTEIG